MQDVPDPENVGDSDGLPVQLKAQEKVVPAGKFPVMVPVCDQPDPLFETDFDPVSHAIELTVGQFDPDP